MTLEPNVIYAIKEKDFRDYAKKWFAKELEKTVGRIDDCLAKVQELKKEGDAYPQRALLPICDIISTYRFNYTGMLDYDYRYYRDFIEKDFIKETNLFIKNKDYCFNSDDDIYDKTRIIYSDEPDDYDDLPAADFIVSDDYNDFVNSVVTYALNTALAKSDLLSAAVISVYTEKNEFMDDEVPSDENGDLHVKDTVDILLDKTPLFSDVQYDETNLKAKNKEKVNQLISELMQMKWAEEREETLEKKQEAYELLKRMYPDHLEFAYKLLS